MLMIDDQDALTMIEAEHGLSQFDEIRSYSLTRDGAEFIIEGTVALDDLSPEARKIAAPLSDSGLVYCRETYSMPARGDEVPETHLGMVEYLRDPYLVAA